MKSFNLFIAIIYNSLIVALLILAEITAHDKTGQGLIGIPILLMLATLLHGILYFFAGLKQNFMTGLLNVIFVVGVNVLFFFADILFIVLIFNVLK